MLENREGQPVPHAIFKTRRNQKWVDVRTNDLFANKTVIVFSLPGAFTPTCSSSHVPRFNELAPVFKANGVDDIICISVNDTFVMDEWKEQQKAANIRFIPDGNGEFTKGMGMLVDKNDLGFGQRSWRYSMLVKNGVIDKMFIEPDVPGDPYEVSDADTMLEYINPKADKPLDIVIFTKNGCPFCAKAKALINDKGIEFEELILNKHITGAGFRAITASESVPQVFINGQHIGGSEHLEEWLAKPLVA